MIIVTGGAGFIGSAFIWKCNKEGLKDILIVDNLNTSTKWQNLVNLKYLDYLHKDLFMQALMDGKLNKGIRAIIHMGACSATTEKDADYLMENNYRYTRYLAEWCLEKNVRFIYASSAATYGNGELGFSDDHQKALNLRPINRYGYSKHVFDLFAIKHELTHRFAGLKFFNVFGPNENHKNDMRSVICKAYSQISETNKLQLFKSYDTHYEDGGQKRDFIYVKDCVDVIYWLMQNKNVNGIYNVGTGHARTWNDLANATFKAMGKGVNIEYIDMPENLRKQYQYFTEADIKKLRAVGYTKPFTTLEDAVNDYVTGYLKTNQLLGA